MWTSQPLPLVLTGFFQRRLMLFVFDKASDLLMDERKLCAGVIGGMQGLRNISEITFILSNLCAADLWK